MKKTPSSKSKNASKDELLLEYRFDYRKARPNRFAAKMATKQTVQYVSDAEGKPVGVFVPIELWREIESERETAYLLKSKSMKKRLLEARARRKGFSLEEVRARLGI